MRPNIEALIFSDFLDIYECPHGVLLQAMTFFHLLAKENILYALACRKNVTLHY